MSEFISNLIGFVLMSIANNIDLAFNNLISIDAIIVSGSFILIDSIFKSFGEIGIYTYRTTRENEWKNLWFNILFSIIIGIIIYYSKGLIVTLFDLTSIQQKMLSILLNFYIAYILFGRLTNTILEMIKLNGNNKLYRDSLILYYVTLIGLDTIIYLLTKNLTLLFVATIISWIITIIYMLSHTHFKFEYPDKEALTNVMRYGFIYSGERVISRVFILIYGILASYMGTYNYSVHTVCFSVLLSLEIITGAYQSTLMGKLPHDKTYEKQYNECMQLKRDCFKLSIILNFIFAFIYLVISHGSLSLYECLPYILFYAVSIFGIYEYETYKALCILQGKSIILLIGTTIGLIIRFTICLAYLDTNIALFIFGLVNLIDFYIRALIYKYMLRLLKKQKKLA